ncbi:MAG: hypothetical protein JSV92_00120 [archaeon]|nr:MAG: hypothetical protein JSV92_00120 [archaeon]
MCSLVQASPGELKLVQIKYDPFPAEAGKYFKLFLKAENIGTETAENAICELDPEYPFSLDPNEEARRVMGEILPGQDFLLEYKIRVAEDAVNGENELRIKCDADGIDDGTFLVHKLKLEVDSRNPEFVIGRIKSVPEDIKAGMEDVKLEVELQNVGEGDASLVTTKLSLPEGFEPSDSYSDSYSIGNFEKDTAKTAVFYIDTEKEMEAGTHIAKLNVRYKYDNNQWEEYTGQEIELEINVKKSPILKIEELRAGLDTSSAGFTGYVVRGNTVVSPSNLYQGETAEIRVTVKNYGEEEAESVSVKVLRDSAQPFEFEELYDFIGNLEPNQSGDAVIHFTIDEDAILKKYFLELEIRYVEGSEVYTERDTVQLEIAEGSRSYAIVIVVIAIVALVSFLIYWKRKGIPFTRKWEETKEPEQERE